MHKSLHTNNVYDLFLCLVFDWRAWWSNRAIEYIITVKPRWVQPAKVRVTGNYTVILTLENLY